MDFKSGILVTGRKVTKIPVKYFFIKATDKMSAEDKVMTINLDKMSGVLLHSDDWLEGVDYEYEIENEDENINKNEHNSNE